MNRPTCRGSPSPGGGGSTAGGGRGGVKSQVTLRVHPARFARDPPPSRGGWAPSSPRDYRSTAMSPRLELRVEHRAAAGTLEVAAEAELDLGAVERRGGRVAAERLDVEHREGVAGHPDDLVERLPEPVGGR